MHKSENKNCQNCKKPFVIEEEDFNFYEKIKVPPPTWCSECRMVRKMLWRNERILYRRECDLCHKETISLYPKYTIFPVYCHSCWWSDNWDPTSFGVEYNLKKNFFIQFQELIKRVPRPALIGTNNINSNYVNYTAYSKNCYMTAGSGWNENCMYVTRTMRCKESIDCFAVVDSELCYENNQCGKNHRVKFSNSSDNSVDSSFLTNCKNVNSCIGCINLRSQRYHLFNKPCSKQEFEKMNNNLGSHRQNKVLKDRFEEFSRSVPHEFARMVQCVNSSGDELLETKNVHDSFYIRNGENAKHCFMLFGVKDTYDCINGDDIELMYDSCNLQGDYAVLFSLTIWFCHFITYSDHCFSSSHLFGCIGLRNKEYCILNKQYSKEEYEKLKNQIIEDMKSSSYRDTKGRVYSYGEFFPPEFSPFAYNETIVQEYFPLAKNEAREKGYKWRDSDKRNYAITIPTDKIPDDIKDADENIVQEVIACSHDETCLHQCTSAFKILPQELQIYKTLNVPLPRLCPNCRHAGRKERRNPLKLWHRKCMKPGCKSEFETSYAPDRPEIVYCEKCYQQEVY